MAALAAGLAFVVPASEIRESSYDLSLTRYKKTVYKEERYDRLTCSPISLQS